MFNRKKIKMLEDKIEHLHNYLHFHEEERSKLLQKIFDLEHPRFSQIASDYEKLEKYAINLRLENNAFREEFKMSPWWKM